MITRIRREGEAIRALLHDHYPTPGTWTETVYWLAVGLHTRIRHALHPLTEAEQAANMEELLTGTPPALPGDNAQNGDAEHSS